MNIFVLHENPVECAKMYCDQHNNKIILEIAQMLCDAFNLQKIPAPYKLCHPNHPVTKWVRQSKENFEWAVEHVLALYEEKMFRTNKGHKSIDVIQWAIDNYHKLSFPFTAMTKFAIAINENQLCRLDKSFNESDPVLCYRLYYMYDKKFAKWTKRNVPEWFQTSKS
jgi:hypothetical protein